MEFQAPAQQMGYDRAIVVFSPEGRMYQVEYARKAVDKATTVIGVAFNGGVVIAGTKILQKLLVSDKVEKVSRIDDHIGVASCGILADCRVLVDYARVRCQVNKITYDEKIEVASLVKDVGDRIQRFTQIGGIRPYGCGMLFAGSEDRGRLFETDPSGTVREWKAHAIGRGTKAAKEYLITKFKDNMTREGAVELAIAALKHAEPNITERNTEIGIAEAGKFNKLDQSEVKKIIV
ncbi:MAG: archaeal proteasome endopeptidase complex subunit alpha [Candidatus Aenigmarchaeota archaeon]|nr:archaeal proteasome endopeptidase complex subunit alpha [Candidatus Aenigmarchaeota archaeon]